MEEKRALFLQRFVAFMIDMLFVSTVAFFITKPFVNHDNITKLQEQSAEVLEQASNSENVNEEALTQYMSIYYKLSKAMGVQTIITILLNVCYFIVYQTSRDGQTIGKKLMKIRVVSENGELSYNQMIFRSFIANSILIDLIVFTFMLFVKGRTYFYISASFELIQYGIMFLSALMIMNRKKGYAIHDVIMHTKVIRDK